MDIFINLLFGHLIGDYFLQPKFMAVKKGASNWIAIAHCAVYTLAVACFTSFSLSWLGFVFITHFIVDRWSLADKWLQFIHGRDLPDFFWNGHLNIPDYKDEVVRRTAKTTFQPRGDYFNRENNRVRLNYQILRGAFHALVYLVIDNSIHLISMYYAYPYLN